MRAYYRGAPAEDLRGREPVDLYGAALSHWTFGRGREPDEALVRVYNPTFEQHGWQSPHTAIDIVSDDMPFLVDSVSMELSRREAGIHVLVHPVIGDESYMHIEIDRQAGRARGAGRGAARRARAGARGGRGLAADARAHAGAARRAPPPAGVDPAEVEEARALLAWLSRPPLHVPRLPRVRARRRCSCAPSRAPGSACCAAVDGGVSTAFAKLPPAVRAFALEPHLLVLTKANARSPVHRPSYLDYVGVKRFDADGNVIGERRFLGLYTTIAYREVPANIPVLRRTAQAVLDRAGFPPGSHDHKALVEIIDTFPRDELFQMTADELYEVARGILELGERQRVRLFLRTDRYERFVSCLVFLPRDRFNTDNRMRIAEILREALGAETVDWELRLTESVLVRIHYTLRVAPGALPDVDADGARGADRRGDAQLGRRPAGRAARGERRGAGHRALPPLRLGLPGRLPRGLAGALGGRRRAADRGARGRRRARPQPLPAARGAARRAALQALPPRRARSRSPTCCRCSRASGLTVSDERPYLVTPRDAPPAWIYDFGLQAPGDVDADAIRERFHEGFVRVWHGEAELDGFNGLIIAAGLDWREVTMLRAVARYLRQAGIPFSDRYMEQTLLAHADVAAALVLALPRALRPDRRPRPRRGLRGRDRGRDRRRRQPRRGPHPARLPVGRAGDAAHQLLPAGPEAVRVVQARPDADPAGAAAAAALRDLRALAARRGRAPARRLGRPRRPALVRPPRGLPHRDPRPDEGADGQERADRAGRREGRLRGQARRATTSSPATRRSSARCWTSPTRSSGGEVVPPAHVVRHDGDDPYLVVAADKGTATFSDIANGVAQDYGFWLGDAFASGGSVGYDHKAMGITARRAWVSVQRHFRELGVDVQAQDFTVVGVGDMSGDVFGNGMLLSPHIRLVAAFDHRHVFLDPDPDAAAARSPSGGGCSSCRARRGRTTTRR